MQKYVSTIDHGTDIHYHKCILPATPPPFSSLFPIFSFMQMGMQMMQQMLQPPQAAVGGGAAPPPPPSPFFQFQFGGPMGAGWGGAALPGAPGAPPVIAGDYAFGDISQLMAQLMAQSEGYTFAHQVKTL
jgi:hypothetical protein